MADRKMPQEPPERRTTGADAISSGETPGPGGTNPFTHERAGATGGTGAVNPSDTTVGTEGWGLGDNEDNTTGRGQGRLGRTERDQQPRNYLTFNCSDIHPSCNWQASGRDENELRSQIEQHGREHHGIRNLTEDIWNRVRQSMHRNAA